MFDQWIQSEGIIKYGKGYRMVANISPDLASLYRSFIPKTINFNIPKYYPHVTIVRGKYETPSVRHKWGKHQNEKVKFEYSPEIKFGKTYIWLPVRSEEIKELRFELGLDYCFDKFKGYHITIANTKNIN